MSVYTDNGLLFDAYRKWYAAIEDANVKGLPEPNPPIEIVRAATDIPEHLASKGNFSQYTFTDEMIQDARADIVKAFRKFEIDTEVTLDYLRDIECHKDKKIGKTMLRCAKSFDNFVKGEKYKITSIDVESHKLNLRCGSEEINVFELLNFFEIFRTPFSYFTQISYYAFIGRIVEERKHAYIRHKLIANSDIMETVEQEDDENYKLNMMETLKANLKPELEEFFEPKKEKKEKVSKKTSDLDELF